MASITLPTAWQWAPPSPCHGSRAWPPPWLCCVTSYHMKLVSSVPVGFEVLPVEAHSRRRFFCRGFCYPALQRHVRPQSAAFEPGQRHDLIRRPVHRFVGRHGFCDYAVDHGGRRRTLYVRGTGWHGESHPWTPSPETQGCQSDVGVLTCPFSCPRWSTPGAGGRGWRLLCRTWAFWRGGASCCCCRFLRTKSTFNRFSRWTQSEFFWREVCRVFQCEGTPWMRDKLDSCINRDFQCTQAFSCSISVAKNTDKCLKKQC